MRVRMNGRPFYLVMLPLLLAAASASVFYALKAFHYELNEHNQVSMDKSGIHLVLVSQELDNPYWRQIEHGARISAEKLGVTIEYIGPIQASVDEQLKLIEMAVASKIDGILTQGLIGEEFEAIVNKAKEMDVPVITIDSDAPHSARIAYVGTDNYAAGYMAGKALIKDTGGHANVGVITGSFTASNQKERVLGFMEAVKQEDGIRIVDIKESNIDRIQSAAAAYSILGEHGELDTFLGTSALDGLGIAQMLKEARSSLDPVLGAERNIRIIGFDDLPETMELIEKGNISATVIQKPYQIGMMGVELMLEHINDHQIVTVYNTDVRVIRMADLPNYRGGQRP
jgi:ribose transport system substrate-binding protein